MSIIGTVRIIRVSFLEDEIFDGSLPRECYENAVTEEFDADDVEHAVSIIRREGLTFAATGTDWAANPDGSVITNYATAEREETTAHLHGFSAADVTAIVDAVG